jgi:hypothetical protein
VPHASPASADRPAQGRRRSRPDAQSLALVAVVAVLGLLSFLMRVPCLAPRPTGLALALTGCHGDLQVMWFERGLAAGYVPYLQPYSDPVTGRPVTVEYPVITGVLMWVLSRVGSYPGFVALSTAVMALAAVTVALLLRRWCGRRAWLWAAAPALVHYLSYNYDALPALASLAALGLLRTQEPLSVPRWRVLTAAAVLGIGGALKLYPLLLVLPLVLWLLHGRPGPSQDAVPVRVRRAVAAGAAAAGVFAVVNLPFALGNPQGWWLPFSFQAGRPIDWPTLSVWYLPTQWWPTVGQPVWLALSSAATAAGIAAAATAGWLAARRRGTYPLLSACLTVLTAYVLLNKVLAGVRARYVVGYLVLDVAMFWTLGLHGYADGMKLPQADALVVAMLAWMLVRFGYLAWVAVRTGWADASPAATPVVAAGS